MPMLENNSNMKARITEASLVFLRRYIPDNQNGYSIPSAAEKSASLGLIEQLDTTNEENELLAEIANMRFVG